MPGIHFSANADVVRHEIGEMDTMLASHMVFERLTPPVLHGADYMQWLHLTTAMLAALAHAEDCLEENNLPGAIQCLNEAEVLWGAVWEAKFGHFPMAG